MRQDFSKIVRRLAFVRCQGRCENCTAKLFIGGFHYDHDKPDYLGGESTLENCKVLCRICHANKTAEKDRPLIDKGRRIFEKSFGIRKKKRHRWGYGKDDPFKMKMDRTIVRR